MPNPIEVTLGVLKRSLARERFFRLKTEPEGIASFPQVVIVAINKWSRRQ